ncbi:MAG: NADH-quinone oxidoreductase subunit A [Ignavibacteriales bacterium]|jgi:NADH-quinone oxidoreductase subunit A|nr:NADH-quinone oxidoreductase subunit A [Ignavibacteriales bacterium]
MLETYLPILLTFAAAVGFAVVATFSSEWFGPQTPNPEKHSTYESGVKPLGTTKDRVSIKYYMVAMLFIIFDLEVVFVYPWATEFGTLFGEHGVAAFWSMMIFLIVFEFGYLYAYKKGGFKWA